MLASHHSVTTGVEHWPFIELYFLALCQIVNHSNNMKHNSCLCRTVRNNHRLFLSIIMNTHRQTALHSSRRPMELKGCCWVYATKEGSSVNSSRLYFCHIFDSPNVHTVWESWNCQCLNKISQFEDDVDLCSPTKGSFQTLCHPESPRPSCKTIPEQSAYIGSGRFLGFVGEGR